MLALTLAALVFLNGCGFTPVYATPDTTQALSAQNQLRQVEIGLIADRNGQYLRNALIDKMGADTGQPQRYFLRIHHLQEKDLGFGLRKDASTTRGDVTLTAQMDVIDTDTNTVVLTRNLRARGGYNRMDNLYGALVAKEDVIDRLLLEMADRTVTELNLFFTRTVP